MTPLEISAKKHLDKSAAGWCENMHELMQMIPSLMADFAQKEIVRAEAAEKILRDLHRMLEEKGYVWI